MRTEIIQQLLSEYEQLRLDNWQEELRRRAEVTEKIPEIAQLMQERQNLLSAGVLGMLGGQSAPEDAEKRMKVLSGRILSLLRQGGYPENYLDPIYRCAVCRDTGYTGEPIRDKCECLQSRFYQRLYQSIGLNAAQEQSFERFDLSIFSDEPIKGAPFSQRQLMERIRSACSQWAEACPESQPRDLMLMGQSGLGKTYLMHAMARRLLQRGKNVLIISAYRFLDAARKAYFSHKTDELDTLMNADILMIDDFGSEPMIENVTITQWFNLINERQVRNLPTVISTNLQKDELRQRYTERIASRLLDQHQSRLLIFLGEDVRRK